MEGSTELRDRLRNWLREAGIADYLWVAEKLYPIVLEWVHSPNDSRDAKYRRALEDLLHEINRDNKGVAQQRHTAIAAEHGAAPTYYNDKSLCVRCTHLRPALDPNIQKAYLGKCMKREWPFTLAITLQGWSECEYFEDSGKAYVPPAPEALVATGLPVAAKKERRVEFYYSSKQKSGEMFPCDNNGALKLLNTLRAAGVDAKAIDVADVKDRFPIYHKSVSGPDATVRPVFGAKGALLDDFGTNVPALLVYEGGRYPTFVFPRTDTKAGLIGVENALVELIRELSEERQHAMA